jgi:hypothetical protein
MGRGGKGCSHGGGGGGGRGRNVDINDMVHRRALCVKGGGSAFINVVLYFPLHLFPYFLIPFTSWLFSPRLMLLLFSFLSLHFFSSLLSFPSHSPPLFLLLSSSCISNPALLLYYIISFFSCSSPTFVPAPLLPPELSSSPIISFLIIS